MKTNLENKKAKTAQEETGNPVTNRFTSQMSTYLAKLAKTNVNGDIAK